MSEARVWLTGAGLVTPLGNTVQNTWTRLVRGERAIGPIELFDTAGERTRIAGGGRGVGAPGERGARTGAEARAAAREAIEAARLDTNSARVGLVVGVTTSGMFETEALLAELHAQPHAREVLVAMLTHPLTSTGDRLAEELGPFVRVRTICSA